MKSCMYICTVTDIKAGQMCFSGQREILCGDGCMDFIHRPKSKILKIFKKF
jgi:hypothetical protein